MSSWLLKKLDESEKNYPNPKYAFNSTVNWMKALRITCAESVNKESLDDFYDNVMEANKNKEYVIKAIASIYSSLVYLQTLKSLIRHENNTNNAVKKKRCQVLTIDTKYFYV